jgi:WD40 repeat protein
MIVDAGDHVLALSWCGRDLLAVAPAEGDCFLLGRDGTKHALGAHSGGNFSISANAAHSLIATAGHDGRARVFDSRTCSQLHELKCGDAWVDHCAWSPDGTMLATAAARYLRVWKVTETESSLVLEYAAHQSTIAALRWRPDSRGIATACYGGVHLVRTETHEHYAHLPWKGSLITLEWSATGRFIAGGSQESTIQFWKLPYRPGEELYMDGYATKVTTLAWDSTSRWLASGGGDIIIVWDTSGRGPRGTTPLQIEGHTRRISRLVFQNRGALLASGDVDGNVFISDLKTKLRHVRQMSPASAISTLAWAPDDTALAIGTASGTVALWEMNAPR